MASQLPSLHVAPLYNEKEGVKVRGYQARV
jgi:hypothetical protein